MEYVLNSWDSLQKENWHGELVFAFGAAEVDSAIPSDSVCRIQNCNQIAPEELVDSIQPEWLRKGLCFVADEKTCTEHGPALQYLQQYIVAAFYTKAGFEMRTPTKPSAAAQFLLYKILDPSRSISQVKNMPWHLRYPIADKLEARRIGLPVIIIMPGPSFSQVKPHLKELSQSHLIICVGRSLNMCLEQGVEPDFMVQYDTHLEQRHFIEGISSLKKTVLVSLSSANISEFAWKFRGTIFRSTFNKHIVPSTYGMRVGSEGSLLACMGLAEALFAPQVYIIGANLCWTEYGALYFLESADDGREAPAVDWRIQYIGSTMLRVVDRNGRQRISSLPYVATAIRCVEHAKAISARTGARFAVLSDETLLQKREFPKVKPEGLKRAPAINRDAYLKVIDQVLKMSEQVNWPAAIKYFTERAQYLDLQLLNFELKKINPSHQFETYNDLVSIMKNIRSFVLPAADTDTRVRNLLKQWKEAYRNARKISLAFVMSQKAKLPVLCLESEREAIEASFDAYFPRESVELQAVSCFAMPGEASEEALPDTQFANWLKGKEMAFVSQGVLKRYAYIFDTVEDDNLIFMPPF